jgi:CheY-like chemotaxis protein
MRHQGGSNEAGKAALIVDDEPVFRKVCAEYLSDCGFTVYSAAGGGEALRIAGEHRLDCAVIDLTMPVMDGVAVMRGIRAARPGVKIILVSGYSSEDESLAKAKKENPDGFLKKPFDFTDLLKEVKRLTD